jgi:sulfate adenylyltransferase
MADLIVPHGGLSEPVCRTVSTADIEKFKADAAALTKVPVSDADLSTVYRFGDGGLSPLTGPMDSAMFNRVLEQANIEHNGQKYAWTIPLSLPVTKELAGQIKAGQRVALVNTAGTIVAALDVSDVFEWDKPKYLKSVYLTERTDHPGADMVLKGWDRVVAFQTRNPLHRAHEYALVYGLETLLRQGHNAGACLNPLVGETKGDDVKADVRMHTYEALIDQRGLGEGDSDAALWGPRKESVSDRVILLGLDIKMFYGGPKEAVMHGIYRQNFGFTDIVIGRKHADAPYADGTAIWGDFDAQQIFGKLSGDLKIKTVNVGFAAYYDSIGRVDLTENHANEKPVSISGKQVRETLLKGEKVDPRIMRESTSTILAEAMATKVSV